MLVVVIRCGLLIKNRRKVFLDGEHAYEEVRTDEPELHTHEPVYEIVPDPNPDRQVMYWHTATLHDYLFTEHNIIPLRLTE